MRIAIEAQRIFRINKHGMDFVALGIIRELQKIDQENEFYILVSPGEDRCLKESKNFHIIELKCPTYPLWEQVALPHAIQKLRPDLLHCTSNTAPIIRNGTPLVLTLHDIIYLGKKRNINRSLYQKMGWYYRRINVPYILPKCKKIITVSEFECKRIRRIFHLSEEKILCIHNGYNEYFQVNKNYSEVIEKYINEKDYLLFLGNTDPKKNTARVLKAYSLYLKKSVRKLPLIIADLKEKAIDRILKSEHITEIKSKLVFPGYISNPELKVLYNNAFAFLYPSLRESFGIPILEAMACGTPVITGSTTAMPEIAGPDALFANPNDANDIASKILLLEENENIYKQQVKYGLEHVKSYSWRKSAEALLRVYKEVTHI